MTRKKSNDSDPFNSLFNSLDIVATIQGIEGVATTKSQMGFGFVPTGAEDQKPNDLFRLFSVKSAL
jgi:hypothetical protein